MGENKSEIKDITLNIFGKDYYIQTDEDEEYTRRIAKYLSDEMKKVASEAGNEKYEKIAIIAALNIIDRYFKEKDKNSEVERKLNDIVNKSVT